MTQYFSDKLRVMSFLLIILVLYIHSGFHEIPNEIEGMTFNMELQRAISGMLGRLAVPLFFMISGYLFFLHTENGMQDIWKKQKRRVRTLLIPFIIGCLFVPLFWIVMEQIPFAAQFCNGQDVGQGLLSMPMGELLKTLFYKSPNSDTPCAFQLWFLRDLIMVVALSPLLYIVRKSLRGGYFALIILFGLTFVDVPILPIRALFWFLLGSLVLNKMSQPDTWTIPGLYLLLAVVEMFFPSWGGWEVLSIPIIIIGVWGMWILYDKIMPRTFLLKENRVLATACSFTFFIYLFHEPTLNIIRKVLAIPFGHSSTGFAFSYLLSPWLFAIVWICVGMVLRKTVPQVYRICTGGR